MPSDQDRAGKTQWHSEAKEGKWMSNVRTSTVPTIDLNDGHSIPQLGFGVFQIPPK